MNVRDNETEDDEISIFPSLVCTHAHCFFYRPMHWLLDFLNRDLNGRSREEENSSPARAHIKICKIVSFSVAFLDACNQSIIAPRPIQNGLQ